VFAYPHACALVEFTQMHDMKVFALVTGLYHGWRMIGFASALRVLGGGLH